MSTVPAPDMPGILSGPQSEVSKPMTCQISSDKSSGQAHASIVRAATASTTENMSYRERTTHVFRFN